MIALALLIGAIVVGAVYGYVRNRREAARAAKPEFDVLSAHRSTPRPEREAYLWEKVLHSRELERVRKYILAELRKIESTDWKEERMGLSERVADTGPTLRVGHRCDHADRFIEDPVLGPSRSLNQLPAHFDVIARWVRARTKLADHPAVDGHLTVPDQFLRFAP